jgi:SulP family sulfate permease
MPDAAAAASAKLLTPKFATILSEGYGLGDLRRDAMAGLTVAIVALPLSMAIAIASGVAPGRGLYTAIVGGFLVSLLGGSRFQIGGPAGAFIVLVAATVARFGIDGLVLTVFLSGIMLTLLGVSRLGTLVRHIPHPVTVGFTAGIAVTILVSQLKDFLGLKLAGAEPGPVFPKLAALAHALPTASLWTIAISVSVVVLGFGVRRFRPNWPNLLIAVTFAALAVKFGHLPVETIGERFGGLPHGLPAPQLPAFSWGRIAQVLPTALTFTLLGAIESLLSAVVADGMTGRRHRSNMELVAQGVANIGSSLFGGISVTGTIARTATNVRAGARSPIAGMLHAAFLLAFLMVAAPLANFIPVAALAGVLVKVAWNMAEKKSIGRLMRDWRTGLVLLATFGLTLARDLSTGIVAGCALAALFALARRFGPRAAA